MHDDTLCTSVHLANQSHFSEDNAKIIDVKGMSKSCLSSVNEEYILLWCYQRSCRPCRHIGSSTLPHHLCVLPAFSSVSHLSAAGAPEDSSLTPSPHRTRRPSPPFHIWILFSFLSEVATGNVKLCKVIFPQEEPPCQPANGFCREV